MITIGSISLTFCWKLKSVLSIFQQFSGAGICEGAVKYITGEYKDRPTLILQTSFSLMLIGFLISVVLYFAFSINYITPAIERKREQSSYLVDLWATPELALFCITHFDAIFFHGLSLSNNRSLNFLISSFFALGISIVLIYYFNTGLIVSVFIRLSLLLTYLFSFSQLIVFVAECCLVHLSLSYFLNHFVFYIDVSCCGHGFPVCINCHSKIAC